jgi:murein DD-endopeptidase MepM/ murein hydrolase activator NlpD
MIRTTSRDGVHGLHLLVLSVGAFFLVNCSGPGEFTAAHAAEAYRPAPGTAIVITAHAGETPAKIAQTYSVDVEDVLAMNGLRDRHALVAGQHIYVPAYGSWRARVAFQSAKAPDTTRDVTAVWRSNPGRAQLSKISVSSLDAPRLNNASYIPIPKPADRSGLRQARTTQPSRSFWREEPQAVVTSRARGDFMWPVSGRVVSGFGRTAEGLRNDGVNIAVPHGTPVRAAADGTVTYVGNELKGYGNLLLIKHDNGFVTAYAHADRISVERGERVRRGDVVGYSGSTGDVTQPQLHFEIRQGTRPVNPTAYLGGAGDQASRLPRDPARS